MLPLICGTICIFFAWMDNKLIFLAVLAILNNLTVALLTDISVACADKITEIKSSKGLLYISSVDG